MARLPRFGLAMLLALSSGAAACKGDDDTVIPAPGASCKAGGGPVEDGAVDAHCSDDAGNVIAQAVGKCRSGAELGAAGAGGAPAEEEPGAPHTSSVAQDDDCKYDASFSATCVEVNRPVTLTLKLDQRAAPGTPAAGGDPDGPELYLADNPSHISPSRSITAKEDPPGTYAIGPVVFDAPGRWVVRFHFFEKCSDAFEDSPHGHVAFYVDVP